MPRLEYPTDKQGLYELGVKKVLTFCKLNNLLIPKINNTPKEKWIVGACAYYRPDTEIMREWTIPGINISLFHCQYACTESYSRNWSWPGNVTDREPYGVLAHELGHHCDWLAGEKKGNYYSEIGMGLAEQSGEEAISSYCPNPAEWFAEMFRVFVTNPDLLSRLRPRTYDLFTQRWQPSVKVDWLGALRDNVPQRVIDSLEKKIKAAKRK